MRRRTQIEKTSSDLKLSLPAIGPADWAVVYEDDHIKEIDRYDNLNRIEIRHT